MDRIKGNRTVICREDSIIQQNAVAIVMPYFRSEVSILTAQPGVESVVLPPFNIIEMMNEKE